MDKAKNRYMLEPNLSLEKLIPSRPNFLAKQPPHTTIRVLGVDPGTRFCGYGLVEVTAFKKPVYLECGVLELGLQAELPQRLLQLFQDLKEVLQEFQPHQMAVESVFYGKNVQSALRLGYARGIIMLLCAETGLNFYEYSPATIKRTVAGHGRAGKEEMQRAVQWQCQLRTPPRSDAADALATALCHAAHSRQHTLTAGKEIL